MATRVSNTFYCVFSHRRQALLCLLAKNCTEAGYIRLVEALCNEHNIKLLKVIIIYASNL